LVISVGNIHLGGTGKTPIVIQLANYLKMRKCAVLSRGYKSQSTQLGAQLDRTSKNGPGQFGDEPWLISHLTNCDVYVGAKRWDLIKKFDLVSGYQILFLDDGFQHVQLERSIDVLVLPGDDNPWETAGVPLGSLREGLCSIRRASLILITCSNPHSDWVQDWKTIASHLAEGVPSFVGVRKAISVLNEHGEKLTADQRRYGAFCAIGRPERFFEDLGQWAPPDFFKTYRDHHAYSKADIEALIKLAKERSLEFFVTTEKDFYKVNEIFKEQGFPLKVAHTEYELPSAFWEALEVRIQKAC